VHVRVDKSGEDALSVAIDDFCGIAYPYGYACLVTYIYELAVLDSNASACVSFPSNAME
jgi:hypothetical protein